jgi:hypothetical protein
MDIEKQEFPFYRINTAFVQLTANPSYEVTDESMLKISFDNRVYKHPLEDASIGISCMSYISTGEEDGSSKETADSREDEDFELELDALEQGNLPYGGVVGIVVFLSPPVQSEEVDEKIREFMPMIFVAVVERYLSIIRSIVPDCSNIMESVLGKAEVNVQIAEDSFEE